MQEVKQTVLSHCLRTLSRLREDSLPQKINFPKKANYTEFLFIEDLSVQGGGARVATTVKAARTCWQIH